MHKLFERAGFEAFVAALPATSLVRQWGDASVAKVGDKIFAIFGSDETAPRLSFKCSDMAFELLPELKGALPAPYLARAKWVSIGPETPLSEDECASYLREAHRLIALKLPGRVKTALGLGDYLATR